MHKQLSLFPDEDVYEDVPAEFFVDEDDYIESIDPVTLVIVATFADEVTEAFLDYEADHTNILKANRLVDALNMFTGYWSGVRSRRPASVSGDTPTQDGHSPTADADPTGSPNTAGEE